MKPMTILETTTRLSRWITAGLMVLLITGTGCSSSISSVTFDVKHIYYPDFYESITTTMNKEEFIGDTTYSFKAVDFYPTFSILQSSKKIVSLSDDPKNPAFKLKIYENGKQVEETWAFYGALAPHFSASSILIFRVSSFEYKGQKYGPTEEPEENENDFAH